MYIVMIKEKYLTKGEKVELTFAEFVKAELMADKLTRLYYPEAEVYYETENGELELVYTVEDNEGELSCEYHGAFANNDDCDSEPCDPFDEVGYDPYTGGYDSDL